MVAVFPLPVLTGREPGKQKCNTGAAYVQNGFDEGGCSAGVFYCLN